MLENAKITVDLDTDWVNGMRGSFQAGFRITIENLSAEQIERMKDPDSTLWDRLFDDDLFYKAIDKHVPKKWNVKGEMVDSYEVVDNKIYVAYDYEFKV